MLKINNTSNTRLLERWVHTSREHDVYGTTQASVSCQVQGNPQ